MPIRPELRHFYNSAEWRHVIRPRILERAGYCCERCRKPNRAHVETFTDAIGPPRNRLYFMWWRICSYAPGDVWVNHAGKACPIIRLFTEGRTIRVVLTVAHLNHVAGDDRDENLAALCQWCHLIHDLAQHARSREARKDAARPLLHSPETAQAS